MNTYDEIFKDGCTDENVQTAFYAAIINSQRQIVIQNEFAHHEFDMIFIDTDFNRRIRLKLGFSRINKSVFIPNN